MVRETRHLWVGNLPDDIREEKLVEHFARYGRVESAKLTGKRDADGSQSAFVDFVDINSATKAHDASVITIGERDLQIEYNNPDSPTEIHPGESSREYELPGRIPRYENRRGGTVEDRYDPAGSTYEFDRSYGQHYGRENSQYRDESSSSPAYRERQRERTRANFYSHSRSSDQYENDPDYLKDSYGENFGDASLRKSRLKPFKTLPGQSKSPSARSGSGSGRKSKSNSRSRSRSRSKSTDSHSSDTGSEGWSRSRSRDRESDRESRNTETTQSSLGGSTKFSGLCVRNLPARSSDSSIKDGLFHEFKKYGQVTAVTVQGVGEDRKGIVFFKRAEDMEKAMEASRGNSFFGCEMALSVWDGADLGVDDSEVKYFEKELDEFHPRATRTLFVGNLDRSVTREDLNEAFHKFGEIVHIEIKKPAGAQPFAFLQFSDIDSVVRARKKLDGEYVGKNKVKLGFGKSMATNCVWLDNLSQKVTEKYLMQFCGLRFGEVTRVVHDRRTNMALVFFINIDDSQKAVQDLKIGSIMGRRPKVDFASRECQNHFYDRMEQTGQAAYYNHSGETSPSCPTYPERNFKKSSGDYRGGYNSSTPFEPRRASRAQSSGGGFTKYSSGSYEDRYPYPSREEGYHERPYSKEYSSIRSSSYDGDDYQQELLEYGYHQKERTKEQYRDRSGSSSPSCRERSADGRQKSLSVEPADDVVSPVGSVEEGPVSRSPSPKRKWKGNSLLVQNSKEGSSTPMPRSPLSEEGLPEEPSWKNRNGNSGSERGSSLDQTDLLRKTKSKLSLDIPREEDLIERKKKVPPKLPGDKSSSPYLERPKGDPSLHGDSQLDRTRDPLEGDKDSWVDKFKDKKSPRSDFLLDKPALKRGLDVSESVSSLQHDLDSGKRWKDGESNADSMNDASSVGDQQKKLEARKQRFSDNSPVDIQKIRKERYFPPTSGKVPKLGKGNLRDSEYIPKGDSFLGDSRTVEDSHMSHKEGVPPDPSDNSNGGPPCKHNDRIDSFWWMPGQKLYSDDEKGEKSSEAPAEGTLQPQQPCSSETAADGGTTQAALNKPKKSIPDNSNLSQDRTRKRHKGRIPHISNDMDEGIASSSDQETPGSEEELGLKPLNSHSAHSNALQGSQGSDNLHASVKSTAVDTFEKPPQLDSKLTYRKQVENPRNKTFDVKQQARQRHPSLGDGQQVQEGKPKVMDDKGRAHNSKRKEQVGTVIQEMEWKMIPLDPITFPPSGRKEQIDAIFFGSGSDANHPTESGVEGTKLGLKTDSKAAGSLSSDLNNIVSDQYCNPLSLNTVESENIRNDSDQLPLLSPKPATKVGNTASPPTSAPPHLSPAVTPLKTKEDIQADLAKANVTKLIGEPLHPKPNSVILDSRNCQKTTFPDRDVKEKVVLSSLSSSTLSSLNEKSSYLRPGEEKVNSWLRQIPSPTLPVTLDSTGESREQRSFLLIGSNNGSPSLSVTPSTPSTPSTPNDGRLGEVLSTKTRVERLSMCRIVKKNRNSVDVDNRNDKKAANDELIKYFQDRMQQNSIFSLDEARLNSDQSKLRVGVAPSISTSGSLLSKSKSEDVGPAESMKLNRSNSDPRMAAGSKLLSLPKSIDSTAAGMQQVTTLTQASLSSTLEKDQDAVTNETSSAKPDVGKEDPDIGRSAVDLGLKRPTPTEATKDSLTSPSLPITKEIPKLKSILKKRTDSVDDVEEVDDVCSKEIEQGIKRKRSPSPVSGEAKKIHTASVDTSERKTEDPTLPSTPKFQHPTNMLLLSPNERTKKFVVKPRSKPKTDKNAVLPVNTKKTVEKPLVVKKEVSTVKKEVSKGIGEMVKSKSVMREKGNLKSSGKKVEKKEERKIVAEKKTDDKKGGEKKIEEKKHVEKKNVVERKEEKKSSEKQEVRKGEEKVSERKVEDVKEWKKEEKKVEKKDEKKTVMERKVERRSDDKKQSEKKAEEKKSVKKSDEKKIVKDGKSDDKRGSERKVLDKKSTEKKGEEKRGGEKKVEEKKVEKRGDEKKAIERKGDEKKVTEKKLEEKKVDKKEDRKVEERKVTETQKKTSEKKVEKKVEEKRPEKKMEEKKPLDKKGDKKGAVPVVVEKRKPEKVSEKTKDTKSSEKSLPKKSEEKISETRPVEKEKFDKSKSKSSKKLQKADSTDSKMKKPAVKETLKVRSKSEDKPKGKSPQVSPEKSSASAKKVSTKVSGSSSTPVVSDGTGFGPGGFGGGVRALMDSYAESDSSESEDDEFEIFHQAASSGVSKTQKAPALKKNVIFSSSDESDSETTERRNPNPVLQKLFDRESLSDSDFDEKPSSSLVMSSEAEESPSRKQSPVKGKGKQIKEKSGRDKIEKEKSVETKKSKVEKEPKEVEKAVKRNEVIEPAEVKRGQDAKKSSPKKTEVKAESRTKDKSGRSRSKKEGKESKASKVEETEEMVEVPVSKSKAKKRETEMEKMHSRGKKMEVFDDSLSESFDEPIREQEEEVKTNIIVEPEVKVQKGKPSKKSGKSKDKTKKGKNKPRHDFVEKPVVSKDEPGLDSWKDNIEEEVESKAEIEASTPLLEEEVKEPEPEPLPEIKPEDDRMDNDMDNSLENPPVQEYETEVVVEKVAKEEETPIAPVSIKVTKGKQKRKKGKHRQTKKGKKEPHPPPPEEPAPVIPEITVSSEPVEPVKQDEDRITEKESEIAKRPDDEMVLKSDASVGELPQGDETSEMMDECTDAEKAAAMFEETAEATAALELVEIDEQQRQRELAEEIFGEATPTAPSPSAPPTPSPTLPSPRPVSPRPSSPEIPETAHADEVSSTSEVKIPEVVVSSIKEEVEEDVEIAKVEKPSPSVHQEEVEQELAKTEKEETEIQLKDKICDQVKTEMELPKIESPSAAIVTTAQEPAVKVEDEVRVKTEVSPVKSEEILNEMKESSQAEAGSISLEAAAVEIPLQGSCHGDEPKSSLLEGTGMSEVKVNSGLPEVNTSENSGVKLEDVPDVSAPLKVGDCSQELKSEDLEGAEETASVEVTTETASEANDSLVIAPEALDMPAPFELPEKLPTTPTHKGKKKKKRKHRDKKSSKKESKKVDKEKKKKRKKSKSKEGKRKRQKTSHKSGRHRSVSSSSYGDLQMESHKNMERITEQATSASMEPVVNPSGLPIHKIENQQVFFSHDQHWHPGMDGMGNNFYRIPASMPGFPPGMPPMFSQSTAPIDNRFMKPPMVNSNLCSNEGNTSPLQTINADDMSLKIVGVNENIKLINFRGMKVDTPGQVQVAGMLSPSSSDDKTKKRHPSGKSGIVETLSLPHSGGGSKVDGQTLDQMQHMVTSGQAIMVKEEVEERDGTVMQNKSHQVTDSTMQGNIVGKDVTQEGYFEGASESDNAKVNTKDLPQKSGDGATEERSQEGDVYDFNEEEPSVAGRADQTRLGQSQKNASVDVYEFQESPGPSSSKASPSKMASAHRGKQKSRVRGGRTRSNSRGSAKDLKVKEEGQESGLEETKKVDSQVFPQKIEGEAESLHKGAVAELVPSSDSKVVAKSEDPGSIHHPMPLSLPNTGGVLAGLLPIVAISQAEKQMMYAADPHVRMMANVSAAQTTMATALQNKQGNGRMMPCHNSALAPSVSMPAVVAALNNNPANAKQHPHMDIRNTVSQAPVMTTGSRKPSGRKRNDKKMAAQYQPQYTQQPHPQQIRNIPSTQSQVEAVELHFKESLMRNQRQNMVHKPASSLSTVQMPPGQPVAVITSQPGIIPAMITPTGTSSASASREAPAITSQLIGVGTHSYGNRSPAMAEGMKSGPHTVASVPESQTSPDTSIPGVTRSGMHPNLPSTLVSVPTPTPSKRQQGMINSKYECRVPTSVAATSYPDASVLRARLTQIEPKHRGNEEGKLLTAEGQVPGAFLHPSGFVEKPSGHGDEKVDPIKPGDRNVPTEQRLPAAYHPDGHMVYFNPRPDGHPVIRGPGPVIPGMFPDPAAAGLQGLPIPSLVHPGMDISKGLPHHGNFGIAFGGPFPPRMFHPSLVHGDQNQPLASPRALASPRMVVPNTSSPRLSPKIKSPGLGHGDRTAQTPDKQAEHHNVVLRHPQAPGISTGIPPSGPEHPEVHNLPHRGLPHMMAQQPQLSKTERDLDKAPEDRRHHQGPPGQHGIPPHIQQLPAQNIPEHTRTTPGPHPERGSPGSHTPGARTPGPDGRPQQVILPNSSTMKQWPPPGISPHTPMAVRGSHPASPIPSMGGEASVMLYVRYPVMWQGMLALKQEIATIQLHYICGNKVVATDALKMAYPPLRIAQRMRLEDSQLDGVARRMQVSEESVVLLALPCGSDQDEILNQTSAMRAGLISYLKEKQAAGIINVGPPGCTDPSYVIHIFPPCEFTERSLSHKAPDLLESVMNVAYMMFVIATC